MLNLQLRNNMMFVSRDSKGKSNPSHCSVHNIRVYSVETFYTMTFKGSVEIGHNSRYDKKNYNLNILLYICTNTHCNLI